MMEKKWEVPNSRSGESSTDGLSPLDMPLILRHVFMNLQPLDLINCSEVNKMWNYEARSVLRDFKTCVATNKGKQPCRSLRDLDTDLSSMTVLPYTGLRLRIPKHCGTTCTAKITSQFEFLRNHFKLKVLKIDWDDTEWDSMRDMASSCPLVQIMTYFLRDKRVMDTMEEVDYIHIPSTITIAGMESFIPNTGSFSKLRAIRFPPSWSLSCISATILSDFFDAAPLLEILDLEWSGFELPVLAHFGRYELVRNFRLEPCHCLQATREFILSQQPRLERLSASTDDGDMHAPVLDSLGLILKSSAKALMTLRLDLSLLATLRSSRTQPLENLQTLEIELNGRWYQDQPLLHEIRRLNFTRLLPKIQSVTAYRATSGQRRIPLRLLVADAREDDAGDLSRIWKLTATGDSFESPEGISEMVQLLPNVTSLTLTVLERWSVNYVNLWSSWTHLTSASITQSVCNPKFNLDAEFCGIFPAEVAFLQEQDDEFLKSLHLVSIMPSLSSMTALAWLHITLRCYTDWNADHCFWNNNFFLSKVTGHLVLSRKKHLSVTLDCDSPKAVKHLGPYVKLTNTTGYTDDVAGSSEGEQR